MRKWENSRLCRWRNERKFFHALRALGVDFSGEKEALTPEAWVKNVLEQVAQRSDGEYSSNLLKSRAQIRALQSQINPHFLYNTLEMIRSQAIVRGVEEIADMTEILSHMFRYNVSYADKLATWEQEMENVRNYFQIQQYRFPGRFILQELYDKEDEDLMGCSVPRLSLQPLVENAIYHGLEPKVGKGTVQIRVFLTGQRMVIRISDDGVGMSVHRLEEIQRALRENIRENTDGEPSGHGVALVNIHQRLKLYFGEEYGLSFSSVEGVGTIVEMTVPRNLSVK